MTNPTFSLKTYDQSQIAQREMRSIAICTERNAIDRKICTKGNAIDRGLYRGKYDRSQFAQREMRSIEVCSEGGLHGGKCNRSRFTQREMRSIDKFYKECCNRSTFALDFNIFN